MNPSKQMMKEMGYDRSITMFSPDGRLLQVEYAKKTVKQGSTALAIACKDGVVFVVDKRIMSKLLVPEAIEKMFRIDDHIGVAASGIISDARVLVDRSQLRAQQHAVTYDSKIDIISIVKEMCDLKQICTQSGGLRPFGVSIIVGGIDLDGVPRLFETDPTGIFFQFKATVIGEGEPEIEDVFYKEYSPKLTVEEGLKLSLKALAAFDKNIVVDRIDAAYINVSERKFSPVKKDRIEKVLREIRK